MAIFADLRDSIHARYENRLGNHKLELNGTTFTVNISSSKSPEAKFTVDIQAADGRTRTYTMGANQMSPREVRGDTIGNKEVDSILCAIVPSSPDPKYMGA